MMETEHSKLLRKLEGDETHKGIIPVLSEAHLGVADYFQESTYQDAQGKPRKCYNVTRLGCDFLANKFTGEKGILFTAKYVKRFNEMEQGMNLNLQNLSPELQMFFKMGETMARHELEQKRQAEQITRLEENQKVMVTAMQQPLKENFQQWANRCLSAIAESPNYTFIGSRQDRHKAVRTESYERLNSKRRCKLNQRLESARGRAINNGMTSTKAKESINKLSIIASDKDLKPVYESVIKEMMIAYCVEVA